MSHQVLLTGAGSAPTGLIVDPTTLDFPEQPLRTPSPPLTVAVTHPGPGTTTLGQVFVEGAAGPQFALVNDTCTDHQIPSAGSCTVDVQFAPDTRGLQTASLQFVADDGSIAASVPLRGASAPPPATRPALPPTHRDIAVPSVVGKPIETARALLATAGLGVGDIDEEPDDSAPAGRVIRSGPAPGTRVKPGTVVALVTSSGPSTCIVPDVTGQGLETAKANLEASCAEVGAVTTKLTVGEGPTDVVIRTSPEPGGRINKGDAVQLVVSKGGTRVPDVQGMTFSEAEAAIKAKGLSIGTIAEADGIEVPVVIKSSPRQGKIVELGSAVSLTLGKGAPEDSDGEQQGSGG